MLLCVSILFDLILYVLYVSQQFISYVGMSLPGLNQYSTKYLAQGHSAVKPVRLKSAATRSRDRYTATALPLYTYLLCQEYYICALHTSEF